MSACAKVSYEYDYTSLPKFPLAGLPVAGLPVADELQKLCIIENDCIAVNNWLNELYLFNKQYNIYTDVNN